MERVEISRSDTRMEVAELKECRWRTRYATIRSGLSRGGRVVSLLLLLCQTVAHADTIAWPIAQLRPPGVETTAPVIAGVALSNGTAITAYSGNTSRAFLVYLRSHGTDGWSPPQLLVEGQSIADDAVSVSADEARIAIGAPNAPGGGHVEIYLRGAGPTGWILEQTLSAPDGATGFGKNVSLRGELLVVTATQQNGAFYSYRFSPDSAIWVDAGFEFVNFFLGSVSAVTDGERIAYCLPLMMSGCATSIQSESGGWEVESRPSPAITAGTVLGVTATELYVRNGTTLAIYAGEGDIRILKQEFPFPSGFVFSTDGDQLAVSTLGSSADTFVFARDGLGLWQPNELASFESTAVAIQQNRLLSGRQSFSFSASLWTTSGIAGGLTNLSGSAFGIVESVGSELWVGAAGYASADTSAGSIWIYPQQGLGTQPVAPSLAPETPAFRKFFGSAISASGNRVAVVSNAGNPWDGGYGRVTIYDATTQLPDQSIELAFGEFIMGVALEGDTLAISRLGYQGNGGGTSVYRDNGAGFAHVQTIQLSDSGSSELQYMGTVRLREDWLLLGRLAFKRASPTSNFAFVSLLERPPGESWGNHKLSRSTNPLVALPSPSAEWLGLVYDFDNFTGWTLSGKLNNGGIALSSDGCLAIDVGGAGIGCVAVDSDGEKLFLAVPDPVGPDWSLIGASPVLAPAELTVGTYSMRMVGDRAIVGRTNTQTELGGTNIGKVSILTFDEAIFESGFD